MDVLDSVVIGAGQAGLSASYHLLRRGIDHVVLDADDAPGGAWQHRWDSLTMHDVHGIAALPDADPLREDEGRANDVVPAYFADYERAHDLPVVRPVRVDEVVDGRRRAARGARRRPALDDPDLVNATGTWSQPFVPTYPGARPSAAGSCTPTTTPGPRRSAAAASWSSAVARRPSSCSARSRRSRPTRCG